eukprot:3123022-Rhodomonas_salina.6
MDGGDSPPQAVACGDGRVEGMLLPRPPIVEMLTRKTMRHNPRVSLLDTELVVVLARPHWCGGSRAGAGVGPCDRDSAGTVTASGPGPAKREPPSDGRRSSWPRPRGTAENFKLNGRPGLRVGSLPVRSLSRSAGELRVRLHVQVRLRLRL